MNPKSALDGVHVFETVQMAVKNVTRLTVVVKISRQILTTKPVNKSITLSIKNV